jgi:hypothetical protein
MHGAKVKIVIILFDRIFLKTLVENRMHNSGYVWNGFNNSAFRNWKI